MAILNSHRLISNNDCNDFSIKQWRRKHNSCAVEGQSWSSSGVNWKSKKPVHAMREFTKKNRNVLKLQSQNSGDGGDRNEADA